MMIIIINNDDNNNNNKNPNDKYYSRISWFRSETLIKDTTSQINVEEYWFLRRPKNSTNLTFVWFPWDMQSQILRLDSIMLVFSLIIPCVSLHSDLSGRTLDCLSIHQVVNWIVDDLVNGLASSPTKFLQKWTLVDWSTWQPFTAGLSEFNL